MNYYINNQTGEIIKANHIFSALKYFRADGKKVGYKVALKNIYKLDLKKQADGKNLEPIDKPIKSVIISMSR